MGDFYGLKKNNETFNCNDATARSLISLINEKIPSATSSSNKLVDTSAMNTALTNKVDKVAGKGLSTNDYDDTEKGKVAELTERAYKYRDFSFTQLGSIGLANFSASAILGARVKDVSNLPNASHIPIFFNYGGINSNWNVRWLTRDTCEVITTPIEVSFTLRVYYIP